MKRRAGKLEGLRLNMTPMIDVVMLLIVFFLVASKFKSAESDILSLGYARNADPMESADTLHRFVINIRFEDPGTGAGTICTHQGVVYDPMSGADMDELLRKVSMFRRIYPDGEVVIRADGLVEYRYVRKVHRTCREAGVEKVSFAVNPRAAGRTE